MSRNNIIRTAMFSHAKDLRTLVKTKVSIEKYESEMSESERNEWNSFRERLEQNDRTYVQATKEPRAARPGTLLEETEVEQQMLASTEHHAEEIAKIAKEMSSFLAKLRVTRERHLSRSTARRKRKR